MNAPLRPRPPLPPKPVVRLPLSHDLPQTGGAR